MGTVTRLKMRGRPRSKQQRLYLKSCSRCGGDLKMDWDQYGAFLQCLQCGAMVDVAEREAPLAGEDKQATAA